ncbi:hypothetical protein [Clostridium fallax]|nr:hypothetical protein [Clostridium fallax]
MSDKGNRRLKEKTIIYEKDKIGEMRKEQEKEAEIIKEKEKIGEGKRK